MKQNSLIAIIIIAGISITGVSAYSGSISAAQGNFNNLLVTGTCSGCSGEGSYTSYGTIFRNSTITPSAGGLFAQEFLLSNTGAATVNTNSDVFVVTSTGTVLDQGATYGQSQTQVPTKQSATGEYKVLENTTSSGSIVVIKNDSFLTIIHPNVSQFFGGDMTDASVTISPNGQFIGILCKDSGGATVRLVIFQGS